MARLNSDPFQAIADTNRRQILLMLTGKKLSINVVADNFDISRPAISKHIKVLCEAGFVQITEDGRERYCELNPQGFDEIKEWIIYFEQFWKEKLQNLENLLDKRSGKSDDKTI
ncbi:ArsR/SmtB family transcription factor [Mucilaginibacter ginsenosidivorans]|uniref:Helix-turn-helix transcriptional regulator n=1 Tax=Mucilaginibacter ginsenosidivorans TaxID=398053 RepID=A0A5B8UY76_9SPHI|nr:metalloregulator ArsR/SmtB family transcription factor [Mucilaginibacter ginsenosidivorans]QEC63858.1 helix-turn-helix transcriptional regulator [Mucilaginibacter ginsenosidivorans]